MRWSSAFGYWLSSYRRTWRASVFSSFLAPLLYLGSIGFGLGSLVDDGPSGVGVPYVMFVAPGVLAANAMQGAFGEGSYAVLGAMIWGRQYHAQVASPLTTTDVFLGHLAFVVFRILIGSVAFLLIGALLGAFRSWWMLLALPVALLCGLAHAPAVMAFSVGQDNDYGLTMLFRFVMIPMFLFAGTFFPIDQLPTGVRAIAWLTPLWHATTLCRDLALSAPALMPTLGHLAYLGVWTAGGVALALRCYRSKLGT
jgi:lipooligosaccharide transport system permease protein